MKVGLQYSLAYSSGFTSSTRGERALATMAGLGTGAGAPVVKVYHEKSMILPDVSRVLACPDCRSISFLSFCKLISYQLLFFFSASAVNEECSGSILRRTHIPTR
uniref:Uncharacterized protein n=1 Tax=Aegilops tauschii subsp. strangulata TaxID=200361 RepID=A0A453DW68_AEGTS